MSHLVPVLVGRCSACDPIVSPIRVCRSYLIFILRRLSEALTFPALSLPILKPPFLRSFSSRPPSSAGPLLLFQNSVLVVTFNGEEAVEESESDEEDDITFSPVARRRKAMTRTRVSPACFVP